MPAHKTAATTANSRGEVALQLEGQTYHLRPSYAAIEAIEAATGRSLIELAEAARTLTMPLREAGIVAAEMMKAYGRTHATAEAPLTDYAGAQPRRLSEMIHEAGPRWILPYLYAALFAAATGGVDAQGELKPPAEKSPPAGG